MSAEEIWKMSACEISDAVRRKKLSAVEVSKSVGERASYVNSVTNCFASIDIDAAVTEAKAVDKRVADGDADLALAGVPFSVKDLIPARGFETGCGSFTQEGQIANKDATVVNRVRQSGGLLLGKTTTPEFGCKVLTHSLRHGHTLNPWNLKKGPGGSSGGTAAAIASGAGSIAVSTDGGGSSRIPAGCCGVLGIKPTLALVPNDYIPSRFVNFQGVGFNARSVEDLALLLNVTNGPDDKDPWTLNGYKRNFAVSENPLGSLKGMRIQYFETFGNSYVQPDVSTSIESLLDDFVRHGATVTLGSKNFDWAQGINSGALLSSLSARFGDLVDANADRMDLALVMAVEMGRSVSSDDLAKAPIARTELFDRVQGLFQACDIVITPTTASTALPFDQDVMGPLIVSGKEIGPLKSSWYPYSGAFNMTGHPAMSVPVGFDSNGMPIGMQLVGRYHSEELMLNTAKCVEHFRPWQTFWPEI
jgi:aspartyl-tRNA(Asn)/glutamyl-tRNA(Gln) amidotransferase subunit A